MKSLLMIIIFTASVYCEQWHWQSDNPHYFIADNWELKAPDKWQHFAFNYFAVKFFDNNHELLVIAIINIAKEINDGYYEGASLWDMTFNIGGMLCGKFNLPMMMNFEADRKLLTFTFYWKWK